MSSLEVKLLSTLLDRANIARVHEMGLRREAFEDITNRAAFAWMIEYWRESATTKAPTWVVMEHEFPTLKLDAEVDESVEWMVGALQQRYIINRAQDVMLKAAPALDVDPEATVSKLWRDFYDISEATAPRNIRVDMSKNVEERQSWLMETDLGQGMPFGLTELDEHTRGIRPGELAACAAYTKVGKTWLLVLAAVEAHRQGYHPIFFTLEMDVKAIQKRIDAVYSGVSYARMETNELMPNEEEQLLAAREVMAQRGSLYVERPPRGERTVKAMTARARQLGADFLIIDQLSFIDGDKDYTGDRVLTAKHTDVIFELKDEISRESAGMLPCLLAIQLNRESQRGNDGRGQLQNFANASFIEQTVDIAIGLWRNDHMRANHTMGIDIMGTRRGDRESWLAEWRLAERTRMRIRELYVD